MSATTLERSRYDAVIVGARCAGAATAQLLAREGLRVLVVDRSRYGADTLSTHALMRGAVVQLQRWGVLEAIAAEAPSGQAWASRLLVDLVPGSDLRFEETGVSVDAQGREIALLSAQAKS